MRISSVLTNIQLEFFRFWRLVSNGEHDEMMTEKKDEEKLLDLSAQGETGQAALLKSLLNWCASAAIKKISRIDPDSPFFHIREDWGDRFVLWEILSPWVRESVGIETFYPDELDARTTPRVLAGYLAKRIESPTEDSFSLEKYENTFTYETVVGPVPGLRDEYAEYSGSEVVEEPTVFILTCPRSGSTLFRSMLAGHPQIQAPPELHLIQFDSLKGRERAIVAKNRQWMLAGLVQTLEQQMGLNQDQAFHYVSQLTRRDLSIAKAYQIVHSTNPKDILVDKSPSLTRRISWLRRIEKIFVRPRYLFLSRHPYAVMDSMMRVRVDPAELITAPPEDWAGEWRITEMVWKQTTGNITEFLAEVPQERWLHVRYEDLVQNPESELHRVTDFLDIPFDPAILCPYAGDRMMDGVGDPNTSKRDKIDPKLADQWRSRPILRKLSAEVVSLASKLGYDMEEEQGN